MSINIRGCFLLVFLLAILFNFILLLFLSSYTLSDVSITNTTFPLSHEQLFPKFDITSPGDVIVFLHIQKTGGSHFEDELVSNIVNKSCPGQLIKLRNKPGPVWRNHKCYKEGTGENWIFTRRTVGWPCGVHSDYTTLKLCVPKYLSPPLSSADWNLFYITSLRDPVSRFVSEYLHVKRGAKWPVYAIECSLSNNSLFIPSVFLETVEPKCEFFGDDRERVSIENFVNCNTNPAINRMAHMLAGYDTSECPPNSNLSLQEMEQKVLNKAKENLENMAYFGVLEYTQESFQLFENVFSVKFVKYPDFKVSASGSLRLSSQQLRAIRAVNHIDLDLYNWAVRLFKERIKKIQLTL